MSDLHLVDAFYTLQGEGFHAGRRALFVRMPFCNLSCSWCDTEFNRFTSWKQDSFRGFARVEVTRFAVITGGEPMMHKHTPRVIEILKSLGYYIACETNGTYPILDGIDFVTVSPKRFAKDVRSPFYPSMIEYHIHPDAFLKASEFKYVVDDAFDFSVLDLHKPYLKALRHSLSPEWTNRDRNIERILEYQRENPEWIMSLQTHKILGVP